MIKVAVVSKATRNDPANVPDIDPDTQSFEDKINDRIASLMGKRIIGISYTTNAVLEISQLLYNTNTLDVTRMIVRIFNAFIEYDDNWTTRYVLVFAKY